ncbi:MAG: methyltransferase RsmF C-terminal domain-like protein [Candidatus Woesearchaeota archaeon]
MNKIGQFEILNSKAVKKIMQDLNKQFDYDEKLDYAFLKSKKDKIMIINKEVDLLEHEKLRVDTLGLYFGKYYNDGFRLSIEGTQIIGTKCKKNIIELTQTQKHAWLKGEDIPITKENGFVILKSGKDYLGCAKVKNGDALNSVPNARTLKNVNEEITDY